MAYSPVEQGRVMKHPVLRKVATRLGATPAQVALAWLLDHQGVIAIPKAGTPDHVRENRAALELRLTERDLADLDQAFSPPRHKVPLEML
jgi:diketogulonate reductase-like aldo/keto reductase